MAGSRTEWSERQVEAIDNLINKCKLRGYAFEREHLFLEKAIHEDAMSQTLKANIQEHASQRLRLLATDLYSALDYLCYLCYCVCTNNGQPSYSPKARNVKFPYKTNLKTSDTRAQNTALTFVKNNIFGRDPGTEPSDGQVDNQSDETFQQFSTIILNCQTLIKVDSAGDPLPIQQEPTEDARNWNTLHFLRNLAVHRNMVDVRVERTTLYVNREEGWHEITADVVQEREDNPQWESIAIQPGCWITVQLSGQENIPEPLLVVVPRLIGFVRRIRDELLKLAFPQQNSDNGGIREFDDERVRRGWENGVFIGSKCYTWENFDKQCYINNDNFDSNLWAV